MAPAHIAFTPGEYLQLDIPAYDSHPLQRLRYSRAVRLGVEEPACLRSGGAQSAAGRRNNYSLAGNPRTERQLRFNVRIATPPPGQDCAPGVGSSYVFSLKPGDMVSAIGPFGDFHIKPTQARDGVHRRRRGHGSAARAPFAPAGDRRQRAQNQLLVRCALAPGDFLRGVFPRARSEPSELFFSSCALVAAATKTTGPGTWASFTRWCWRNICASTRIPRARNIIFAGRR